MDPVEIQRLIEQNRQQTGQRYAQVAQNIQSPNAAQDSQIMNMQDQKNKAILAMYDHDKRLADQYANPSSDLYMIDPYAREKARAIQSQASAGQVLDIGNQIQQRKDYLQSEREKATQLLDYGFKSDAINQQALQNELDNAVKLQQLKKTDGNSADLTQLLQSILGMQGPQGLAAKAQSAQPLAKGTAQNKAELQKITKQFPGKDISWTQNSNGSFSWAVPNDNQTYLEPNESAQLAQLGGTKAMGDPSAQNKIIQTLLAATIAHNPAISSEATSIAKLLMPQQSDVIPLSADSVAAGVANQPATPENLAKYQAYVVNKDPTQLVQNPGFFGLGANAQLVNKRTGTTQPIDTGRFDPLAWLGSIFSNNNATPTYAAAPSRPPLDNFFK